MKKNTVKRSRISRFAAAAALIIILFAAFPVTNVFADYSIDDSDFEDISKNKEQATVYIWHKGKPPYVVDETAYPVIMAWDGKYYWDLWNYAKADEKVNGLYKKFTKQMLEYQKEDNLAYNKDGDKYWVDDYALFRYDNWHEYYSTSVDNLPLDFGTLEKYGTAISYVLPDVPIFYAAAGTVQTDAHSYYAIQLGLNRGGYLVSMLSRYAKVDEAWFFGWFDDMEHFSVDFLLDYPDAKMTNMIKDQQVELTFNNLFMQRVNPIKLNVQYRCWDVRQEPNGKYSFRQISANIDRKRRHSTSWACGNHAYWGDFATLSGYSELYHNSKGVIGHHGYSEGGTGDAKNWKIGSAEVYANGGVKSNANTFDLFYATAMPMSFLKGDFTVRNGQTVNLDGPISINEGVTVTVEDGGVLCASGWVVNNGTIKVKQGGTLLVMETPDYEGVMCTYNSTPDESAGAVYCDGTIIVMPYCKLHTGGNVGLKLGSTAQVVNYGAVIASNLTVSNNYTIENRGDSSLLLVGYDLTDGGFTLTASGIKAVHEKTYYDDFGNPYSIWTGEHPVDYAGRGVIQSKYTASMPAKAVYGQGILEVFFSGDNTSGSNNSYNTGATASTNTYYTK